jgi:ribonuclease D
MQSPQIVSDQQTLEGHCEAWRTAGHFAFDTEFIRDDTYDAKLCLVQVTTDGQVVLIDPTAGLDLGVFWKLVTDESVVTIVHAGKEDFEVCLRATGQVPRNVFDIQIAAGFVGLGYPLSLVRLVERVVHHRISKGQTLTDWLRRPLTPEQLRYAADDVIHLPEMYKTLRASIEKAGRWAWAREEFQRFEDPEFYRAPTEDRVQRLKGSKKLDGLGLLLLERLVDWRDRWAQERNRPIRALVRDDILVEIARRRPRQARELEVLRGFPQAKNRKIVGELVDLINAACQVPKSEWPTPLEHREDAPMTKALLDLLLAVIQGICYEERLNWSLLGSPQRLRELLDFHAGRSGEVPPLLRGWREQFIGQRLLDLLEGRSRLHLTGWPDSPRLHLNDRASRGR